ncbi:MAG TPA: TadE family protein [Sphingobium sp.]|uniref:TadE/TadG family type IV pilus assembly protein n=1 Tax=Sphingobium sp. TaxID=1912891 RepID=UPI002ED19E62
MKAPVMRYRKAKEERGVATVEFALWSSLLFLVLAPCLDFGLFLMRSGRLSAAASQGAMLAYTMRNANTVDVDKLTQYVNGASGLTAGTVTTALSCNGGAQSCSVAPTSRACVCTGSTPGTFTASAACGSACPTGSTSGFYLTVQSGHNYTPIFPNPWLNGRQLVSSTTVRLQ